MPIRKAGHQQSRLQYDTSPSRHWSRSAVTRGDSFDHLKVSIGSSIATDTIGRCDDLHVYDGFYNEHGADSEPAKVTPPAASAKLREERESRLVQSIAAFCRTMNQAKQVNFTALAKTIAKSHDLNKLKRLEEQKKVVEAVKKQYAGKKRRIEVTATFLMLSDVDTFREQFSSEVLIVARWREPTLDHWTVSELKDIQYEHFFNPNLYVENLVSERRVTITNDVYRNAAAETFMIEKILLRGTFTTPMSLTSFPFDVQDLRIVVTTDLSTDEVEILPNENELSSLKIQVAIDQLSNAFHLYDHVEMTLRRIKSDMSGARLDRPALDVSARIARKPHYYWFNLFAIIFFITQLGTLTFVIDVSSDNLTTGPAARTQVISNLFLTSVNFKLTTSLTMPKLSYLTCVDKYVIASIASVFAVNLWHCILAKYATPPVPSNITIVDRAGMITIIALYCTWNVAYFLWLRYSVCKRRYDMVNNDSSWHYWVQKKLVWFRLRKPLEI